MTQTTHHRPISLAISTCPNDTFAFHAILNQEIDLQGLEFEIELLDIQQLNAGLFAGRFDVAKASFHAALLLADETVVLRSGSALGFGVGPLLLAALPNTQPDIHSESQISNLKSENLKSEIDSSSSLTLCPGEHTTATLLMKLFYRDAIANKNTVIQQELFSNIMPALKARQADFGVCIHEGRFTWQQQGLSLVEDLGTRWEKETGSPLPLGGILARRSIAPDTLKRIQSIIRQSIEYGLQHRDETLPTLRKYAAELDDDVLMQHVNLYVNDWTLDLGTIGQQAIAALCRLAAAAGILPQSSVPLEIAD